MSQSTPIKFLGFTTTGKCLYGGFFTAHDQLGYKTDWFMASALEKGMLVSIPYFALECLQHDTKDPDMIWDMLTIGYREARVPFDIAEAKKKLEFWLAMEWTRLGKLPLDQFAKKAMMEMEMEGEATMAAYEEGLAKLRKSIRMNGIKVRTDFGRHLLDATSLFLAVLYAKAFKNVYHNIGVHIVFLTEGNQELLCTIH